MGILLIPFLYLYEFFSIFFHELGHFLTSLLMGATVNEFAVGSGRMIYKKRGRSGIVWKLRILPGGGQCKMTIPAQEDAAKRVSWWKRDILVTLAGPLFTWLLAFACLFGAYAWAGVPGVSTTVESVAASSKYYGLLQPGDRVLAIEGVDVTDQPVRVSAYMADNTMPESIKLDHDGQIILRGDLYPSGTARTQQLNARTVVWTDVPDNVENTAAYDASAGITWKTETVVYSWPRALWLAFRRALMPWEIFTTHLVPIYDAFASAEALDSFQTQLLADLPHYIFGSGLLSCLYIVLTMLAIAEIFQAFHNLLPDRDSDGGKILSAVLENKWNCRIIPSAWNEIERLGYLILGLVLDFPFLLIVWQPMFPRELAWSVTGMVIIAELLVYLLWRQIQNGLLAMDRWLTRTMRHLRIRFSRLKGQSTALNR